MTGEVVRVMLFRGSCHLKGRRFPYSLFDPELCTLEEDSICNQQDATGFIRLNALRLRTLANSAQKRYSFLSA